MMKSIDFAWHGHQVVEVCSDATANSPAGSTAAFVYAARAEAPLNLTAENFHSLAYLIGPFALDLEWELADPGECVFIGQTKTSYHLSCYLLHRDGCEALLVVLAFHATAGLSFNGEVTVLRLALLRIAGMARLLTSTTPTFLIGALQSQSASMRRTTCKRQQAGTELGHAKPSLWP
eukprot:4240470-Amphidinium_carterae.1